MVQEEIVIRLSFLCLVLCQGVVAFVVRDGEIFLGPLVESSRPFVVSTVSREGISSGKTTPT